MEEIFELLKSGKLRMSPTSWSSEPQKLPFEMNSEDFIKFAEEDLKENTLKSLINAISHLKKSLDCRMSCILYLLGMHTKSKKENWSFPKKIEFLSKVELVAPRILNKINKKRNEIEHDFKKPLKTEIEDFLDIANLFLMYTKKFVDVTYDNFELEDIGNPDNDWIRYKLDYKKGEIHLELIKKGRNSKEIKKDLEKNEGNYIKALKYWVICVSNR